MGGVGKTTLVNELAWEVNNGFKLVVTSRDLNVLKRMGTQKEFDLRA